MGITSYNMVQKTCVKTLQASFTPGTLDEIGKIHSIEEGETV